ncbi:MAG TPA: ABC transporter permease subunit [Tepidisphaeraceae bacterium]|nr:ABC transporter permease subunit [Tepidisphaeraceae bacterium]
MILALWEGAFRLTQIIDPRLWRPWNFPAPSHVLDATLGMLNIRTDFGKPVSTPGWPIWRPEPGAPPLPTRARHWYTSPLIRANLVSLSRLAIGFALSILVGGIVGLAMWRWKGFDEFLGPPLLGVQTLPSICWIPLAILVLGINEAAILFVMVMGSFAAVAIALRDGLRVIPPLYPRAGLMLGARGWKLYRYVLLPASLPALATSLRQGFSFAWRSLMGAELVLIVQRHGLGFLLQTGRDFSDVQQVVAVMIVMVIIGMLADRWVFAKVQARVQRRFGLS